MLSPIEKLKKFLKLESERGFDNRAVVGGLDKILPWWEKEAIASELDSNFIAIVKERVAQYPQLDPTLRSETVRYLQEQIPPVNPRSPGNPQQHPPKERKNRVTNPPPARQTDHSEQFRAGKEREDSEKRQKASTRQSSRQFGTETTAGLDAPLSVLQGVGPRHAQALSGMGLHTLKDLLYHFPRRYDDYSKLLPINRLKYGDEVTVIASVQSCVNRPLRGGQSQMTEIIVTDGTGFLRVNYFNQPWLANRLKSGDQVVLSGKIDMYLGRLTMNSPDWEDLDQEHLHTNRIVPVYPLTAQITQKWLRRTMHQTVGFWASRIPDFLPQEISQSAQVLDLQTALKQVHFPDSSEQLEAAQARLAFDEIFLMQMGVLRQKRSWKEGKADQFTADDSWIDQLVNRLPFPLTGAQKRVFQDIRSDLGSSSPMNRLIQGDVGSGKTVVAALAAAIIVNSDAQAAIMAPTSILAEQHYRNLAKLMVDEESWAIIKSDEIRLLIGSTPESEKSEIRAGLQSGAIKVVVGTHALIEDPIVFNRLRLAVVDEQHRFGVAQRAQLRQKGDNPHLLVMTATPIPRSLALTVYGDLDVSVLDEMPPGREPVKTHIVYPKERERAYQLIRAQVQKGHQAFVVYPLVEQGDREENKAAVEEHARLQQEVFPKLKLGLLHGRMKPDEKDRVMTTFRDKEYDVLVSTTVIEVGVDIPNATVMLIEGADRFGLAQLHQLRGRVGRGGNEAFCLLIPDVEKDFENERLKVMEETTDGFLLAERDLEQRGPGDFLGTRQAGFSELRMAKLTDVRLIEKARREAQALVENNPDLAGEELSNLRIELDQFWSDGRGDIS